MYHAIELTTPKVISRLQLMLGTVEVLWIELWTYGLQVQILRLTKLHFYRK